MSYIITRLLLGRVQVQLSLESIRLGFRKIDSMLRYSNFWRDSASLLLGNFIQDFREVVLFELVLAPMLEEFSQVDDPQLACFIDRHTLILIEETPVLDIVS